MSVVHINMKHSDRCYIYLNGVEHDGYMPHVSKLIMKQAVSLDGYQSKRAKINL